MTKSSRSRRASAALVCLVAAAVAACSSGPPAAAPPPSTTTAPPRTSATAAPAVPRSPLTGQPVRGLAPVLAVKIDNTRQAHPQAGLAAADVVYVEQVEGGLTRLLAVFSSRLPRLVGPVRSARVTDPELLRQYGPVALAYSGANSAYIPRLRRQPLRLISHQDSSRGFRRIGSRRAPYNLFANPRALLARTPDAAPARDVGFRFGPPPPGGRPTARGAAAYPATDVSWAWSRPGRRWVISMDGRPARDTDGARLGASTLVVQFVETQRSRYRDRFGGVTPFVRTVGQGKAYVFRDGQVHAVAWSRRSANVGTRFVRADGTPMPFAPGPVWVLLVDRARSGRVATR